MDYLPYEDASHPYDFIVSFDEDEDRAGMILSMQDYLFDEASSSLFVEKDIHLFNQFLNQPSLRLNEGRLLGSLLKDVAIELGRGPELGGGHDKAISGSIHPEELVSVVHLSPYG